MRVCSYSSISIINKEVTIYLKYLNYNRFIIYQLYHRTQHALGVNALLKEKLLSRELATIFLRALDDDDDYDDEND